MCRDGRRQQRRRDAATGETVLRGQIRHFRKRCLLTEAVVCFRFGNHGSEFRFPASTPGGGPGDKLKRGGEEWTVTAVECDGSGNVVVTLAASDVRD